MVAAPPIDALRSALAPVEALRGEQSHLEAWVRESFATLEALHKELTEWQRDLARQQAELELRTRAIDDRSLWISELGELRRLVRRQEHMLVSLGAAVPVEGESPGDRHDATT